MTARSLVLNATRRIVNDTLGHKPNLGGLAYTHPYTHTHTTQDALCEFAQLLQTFLLRVLPVTAAFILFYFTHMCGRIKTFSAVFLSRGM